jgi:hypothetical protein
MLNLNTACNFYPETAGPWESADWEYVSGTQYNPTGRYLSELNYNFFLRGEDRLFANNKRIKDAKDPTPLLFTPQAFHDELIMNIENSQSSLIPFDISDELEIRNRYLLTSLNISRFENEAVAYETFDFGRGEMVGGWSTPLKVKRTPVEDNDDFDKWKRRLSHLSSDNMSGDADSAGDFYDRRHLCTFYSFDRPLPKGEYPLLDSDIQNYANANWAAAGYANAAEYKEYLWETWGMIFVPKGTATTNIESPLYTAVPYNNVETRWKILHLLYSLRAYYLEQGDSIPVAAKKSAQIVANIIDFSDGNFNAAGDPDLLADVSDHPRNTGPFYDVSFNVTDNSVPSNSYAIDYKQQINTDCTFLTQGIIDAMILEISHYLLAGDVINPADFDFGLGSEIVFGYERQPFITEISVEWDGSAGPDYIQNIAIELVNPYYDEIDLTGWFLKIGSYETTNELNGITIPAADGLIDKSPGRLVIHNGTVPYSDAINTVNGIDHGTRYLPIASIPMNLAPSDDNTIVLTRPAPATSGEIEIVIDRVDDADFDNSSTGETVFRDATAGGAGSWSAVRRDSNWGFIQLEYSIIESGDTVGSPNNPIGPVDPNDFQLAVDDRGEPVSRWGDIEVLSLYGNPSIDIDPNSPITVQIDIDPKGTYFDLLSSPEVLEYIAPMNRPDKGSLPGRININTAPVHVIAAALPPSLIGLNSDPNTALAIAELIVSQRPYANISQLSSLDFFQRFDGDGKNIFFSEGPGFRRGDDQNIIDDIEERDWFMTYLANKFTVRSDVFTAYILVQLGEAGPQRRMIGIFDRSQVWSKNDRPKLVALHPVPDPR